MLTFVEIAHTDKTQNVVIMYNKETDLHYAVYDGNFIVVNPANKNQWFEGFTSLDIVGSPIDKITQNIPDTITIDVWASGGELGSGYTDNNLSYFLDGWEAVENLKYHYNQGCDFVNDAYLIEVDPEEPTEVNWDAVASDIHDTGTVFEADGYNYSIYKTSIRLIDYLLQEIE